MAEEVNSKALAAGSTANRLEFHGRPEWKTWTQPRRRHHNGCLSTAAGAAFAHVVGLRVHLSRYRARTCLMGFHEARRAIRTDDRKMSSHLEFTPAASSE